VQQTITINERVRANGSTPAQLEFARFLLDLGNGTYPTAQAVGEDFIRIPDSILLPSQSISDLSAWVFGDMTYAPADFSTRAILTLRNAEVNELNEAILQKFLTATPIREYTSADSVDDTDDPSLFPQEVLNSLDFSGLPQHKLRLKLHAPVMLLRNLNPSKGLCNGTRLIITHLGDRFIQGRILTGSHAGNLAVIPRIKLSPSDAAIPIHITRLQFPVRLAFAITINKAQGQTLPRCGIYLSTNPFGHGQLYVAASRSGSPDNIRILVKNIKNTLGAFPPNQGAYVKNIVYREVLTR
jgi:ATP-dependent exoDNAse (exonuclease V) alpha subunit